MSRRFFGCRGTLPGNSGRVPDCAAALDGAQVSPHGFNRLFGLWENDMSIMIDDSRLADVLPLHTPLELQIFPVYGCNFRCPHCIFAKSRPDRIYVSDRVLMEFATFSKIIGDLAEFEHEIRTLRFAGIGEPLMHAGICDMIKLASDCGNVMRIELITNGAALNPVLTRNLIAAGLDSIVIVLEGLSDEDYIANTATETSFDAIVANTRYFYERRGDCRVSVSVLDSLTPDEDSRRRFYSSFSSISDRAEIDEVARAGVMFDHDSRVSAKSSELGGGGEIKPARVCSQPFYMLRVNPDGNVVPCCSLHFPEVFGNVHTSSLSDIWHSRLYNDFRIRLLDGGSSELENCGRCTLFRHGLQGGDILDDEAARLIPAYTALRPSN